ncbi:MAG: LETM1 domain-containing protein [Bacteroidota bacterium]
MNPGSKGWLKAFIFGHYKKVCKKSCFVKNKSSSNEMFLYRIIQNTGIIYGLPAQFFLEDHPRINEWNDKEKLKLILTESYLNISFCIFKNRNNSFNFSEIDSVIENILSFYSKAFPDLFDKIKSTDSYVKLEKIIEKRINLKYKISKSFLTSMFQNSMIFMDLVYYTRWLDNSEVIEYQQQNNIKLIVLKFIAAATRTNQYLLKEGKRIFEYFLQSAQLPDQKKAEARKYLAEKINISEIETGLIDSWILRKFCFEISVLTMWSDMILTDTGKLFIDELAQKLNLSDEDKESSVIAVESFVLNNYDKIHYLKNKNNYQSLSEGLTKKISKKIIKNKSMIIQELKESKELVELLAKSGKTKLNDEEKKKVKEQLLDILRTMPSFAIFMVPGGSILLPLLLKVLPEEFFIPSSFKNKEESNP